MTIFGNGLQLFPYVVLGMQTTGNRGLGADTWRRAGSGSTRRGRITPHRGALARASGGVVGRRRRANRAGPRPAGPSRRSVAQCAGWGRPRRIAVDLKTPTRLIVDKAL